MANKIVELTLKVNGAETLDDMNIAAKELEQALREAGKGAEGFSAGMATLQSARNELKTFSEDVKGLTFREQAAGATRFVNGIVSGFALMTSAATLFGEDGSEEIEKVVKVLGSLMTAMTALSGIAQAFDGKTLKSLKGMGQQWTKLVSVVKNASTAMKAALITTGIGAILVGLGLIIANWEKIIKFAKVALGIEKDTVAEAKKRIAVQERMLKLEEQRVKIIEDISKLTGDEVDSLILKRKYQQEVIAQLRDQLIVAQDLVKKAEDYNKKVITGREVLKSWRLGLIGILGVKKTIEKLNENEKAELQDILENEAARENILQSIVLQLEQRAKLEQEMIAYAIQNNKLSEHQLYLVKQGGEAAISLGKQQQLAEEKKKKLGDLEVQRLGIYKETEQKIYEQKKAQLTTEKTIRDEILNQVELNYKRLVTQQQVNLNLFQAGKMTADELRIQTDLLIAEASRMTTLQAEIPFLETQLQILYEQNQERKRLEALEQYKSDREHALTLVYTEQAKKQALINQAIQEQNLALGDAYNQVDKISKLWTLQGEKVDAIRQGYADYLAQYDELNNALDIADGKLQDFIDNSMTLLPSGIRITNEAWADLTAVIQESNAVAGEEVQTIDEISAALGAAEERYTKNLELQYDKAKIGDEDVARAAQQLAIEELLTTAIINTLVAKQGAWEVEKQVLDKQKEQIVVQKQLGDEAIAQKQTDIEGIKEYIAKLEESGVKGKELDAERKKAVEDIAGLTNEIINMKSDQIEKDIQIQGIQQKQVQVQDDINKAESEITKETLKEEASRKRIYSQLKQELKLRDKLGDWWEKNGVLVQASADMATKSLELIGTLIQNQILAMETAFQQYMLNQNNAIEGLKAELDVLTESTDDYKSQLDDLYELREDADSSRLAAIDAEIAALEGKAEKEAELIKNKENQIITAENDRRIAEAKYNNDMAQAKYKQAKFEKANNIVQGVSQGLIAVLQAAPNPVLMAIAAALSVASVAIISAQKIPTPLVYPPPVLTPLIKAKGGFLKGDLHSAPSGGIPIIAERDEWIAPRWMTKSRETAPVIQKLEAIRTRKYADGGTVTANAPTLAQAQQSAAIDYDLLAEKLASINIWTSVAEIRDEDRKFTKVVYNASSI